MNKIPDLNLKLMDNEEHREAMEINYRKAVSSALSEIDQKHADNYLYLQNVLLKECSDRGINVIVLAQLPIIYDAGVEKPSGEHYTDKDFYMFNNGSSSLVWVNGKPDRQSRIDSVVTHLQFIRLFMNWFINMFCQSAPNLNDIISNLVSMYSLSVNFAKTGLLPQGILDSIDKKYDKKP